MKSVVLDRFGDFDELVLRDIDAPNIGSRDVLIRVEYAGIGQWDIFEREGGYAEMLNIEPKFPYILGSEGAGTVVAIGENVIGVNIGDKVYAPGFLNPKGGFYAEYVAVDYQYVSCIHDNMTIQEASVISGVGITALRGLEDILELKKDELIMIFGASGGVGHLAVQLAKIMGARVFAVASGVDGVDMLKNLGVDSVVDGRKDDILYAASKFAPEGFDAALITAGGEAVNSFVQHIRKGGRIAYPNGIYPIPQIRPDIRLNGYNGDPDPEIIHRLSNYINSGRLRVHIDQVFLLEDASKAHLALKNHYLGKLCLQVCY
jgi:NADPH:quinone reductase-like Zn-dependent oxidoreductase